MNAMTPLKESFVIWLAETKGISKHDASQLYSISQEAFVGGHSGDAFRDFCLVTYSTLEVFFSDRKEELVQSYVTHQYMHFLRMLSYPEPRDDQISLLASFLVESPSCVILDYGCGLASLSRALARRLSEKNLEVKLILADIPTARKNFLTWLAAKQSYETQFLDCDADKGSDFRGTCDLVIASEFFEHVYNPGEFLVFFDGKLRKGGVLYANVDDHHKEFMHVTPCLKSLRDKLIELRYNTLIPGKIYRKHG